MRIQVDNPKLEYHPKRVKEWKETGDCFPIYVEMGLTNRCNHRCLFCALDWLEHGGADIPSPVMYRTLENMSQHGVKSLMFAGEGEPFLHRDVGNFVERASTLGVDTAITSNGVPFTRARADQTLPYLSWIRFSIDGGSPTSYAQLHGTREEDFEKALENISYAVNLKRKNNYPVTIGTQALLTSLNVWELESLAKRLGDMGVDNFQIKPYSHHPLSKNDLRVDKEKAEEVRGALEALDSDSFQIVYRVQTLKRLDQERTYSECWGLPFMALVDARGNIMPCNLYYGSPEFYYGNIAEKQFSEIWKGDQRKEVLAKLQCKGVEACRKACRLDPINRYLDDVKSGKIELKMPEGPAPLHVNYI